MIAIVYIIEQLLYLFYLSLPGFISILGSALIIWILFHRKFSMKKLKENTHNTWQLILGRNLTAKDLEYEKYHVSLFQKIRMWWSGKTRNEKKENKAIANMTKWYHFPGGKKNLNSNPKDVLVNKIDGFWLQQQCQQTVRNRKINKRK